MTPEASLKMSWQTDADRLVCRWSEFGERLRYNPDWLRETSSPAGASAGRPVVPVFTRLSSFGGAGWYGVVYPS